MHVIRDNFVSLRANARELALAVQNDEKFKIFHNNRSGWHVDKHPLRDDAHMTPMKIIQFSRPPPPCPSTSKILPPPWPWTSNFERTPLTTCFFVALYCCVCSCPKISRNVFLFIITHIFITHFAINLFYLHNFKT